MSTKSSGDSPRMVAPTHPLTEPRAIGCALRVTRCALQIRRGAVLHDEDSPATAAAGLPKANAKRATYNAKLIK